MDNFKGSIEQEKNLTVVFIGEYPIVDINKAPKEMIDLYKSINESFLYGSYYCNRKKHIAMIPKLEFGKCSTYREQIECLLKHTLEFPDVSLSFEPNMPKEINMRDGSIGIIGRGINIHEMMRDVISANMNSDPTVIVMDSVFDDSNILTNLLPLPKLIAAEELEAIDLYCDHIQSHRFDKESQKNRKELRNKPWMKRGR